MLLVTACSWTGSMPQAPPLKLAMKAQASSTASTNASLDSLQYGTSKPIASRSLQQFARVVRASGSMQRAMRKAWNRWESSFFLAEDSKVSRPDVPLTASVRPNYPVPLLLLCPDETGHWPSHKFLRLSLI